MKYIEIERIPNGIDTVKIDKKEYIIRFSAKSAQHVVDNYHDTAHNISFSEIITLVKNSIYLPGNQLKKVFLSKFKSKIYETYFIQTKERIDIVTSFVSNKIQYIEMYKEYEKFK